MLECQICYDRKRSVIKCFHKCSGIICHCCFKKLIELNKSKKISYQCPICREVAVRHINRKFTMYCNKNIDLLKKFVSLLEKQNELDNERQADEQCPKFGGGVGRVRLVLARGRSMGERRTDGS